MTNKSLIHREKKREKLEQKYHLIRQSLEKEIKKVLAPTRLHGRCFSTRKPGVNYRDFGLSGHILREMVHACLLSDQQDQVGKD
ncbi:hypothetical protein ACOSQ2_027473 [Xanthoceras sorbifolium]